MFFLKFLAKMLSLFSPALGFATLVVAGIGYGIYRFRRMIVYRYYRFRRRRMPGWKPAPADARSTFGGRSTRAELVSPLASSMLHIEIGPNAVAPGSPCHLPLSRLNKTSF
jgi:hypothetical protein